MGEQRLNRFIVVSDTDIKALSGIDLFFPAAVLTKDAVIYGGKTIEDYEIYPRAVCFVGSSDEGVRKLKALSEKVVEVSDCNPPEILRLNGTSQKEWGQTLYKTLLHILMQELRDYAERNVMLNRSIALMRKEQERTLDSFAKMEKFVLSHNLIERKLSCSLEPSSVRAPLQISAKCGLEQRLPVSSAGLSDIAIFVHSIDPDASGVLQVILHTIEDNEICAKWHISANDLKQRMLRLSLPVSLSGDAMTPRLRVRWAGEGAVSLATSLHHPDTRYQASHPDNSDGRVLALRCWSYIAGSQAPLPADAHFPVSKDKEPIHTVHVTTDRLKEYINITSPEDHVRLIEEDCALLVHAMENRVAVAAIPQVIPGDASKVVAEVTTTSENGPEIEYALGVHPSLSSKINKDVALLMGEGIVSDWVRMSPLDVGEVQLLFDRKLGSAHDLFLMTRLAQGQESAAWAWSTFRNIRVTVGQELNHDR